MKFMGSARFYAHHWPLDDTGRGFRDYAALTEDRMTFLVTAMLEMKPELYDLSVPKAPLDIILQGGYVGNSSLNSKTIVLTSTGQELISSVNQIVSIDKATRRPLPLPDWWKKKYAEKAKSSQPLKFSKIDKPENVPVYTFKVARSDVDGNNHANWSVYVRCAFDAMYHFSKTRYLSSMPDFDQLCVKRMELLYIGESFDDDVLQVNAWEDNSQALTVIVHVNKGDTLLFQGKFIFFDNENLSSPVL